MITATLNSETDFNGWRQAARKLAGHAIEPGQIEWRTPESTPSLFSHDRTLVSIEQDPLQQAQITVPREFLRLACRVAHHRDHERFSRLYRLLMRLQLAPKLLKNQAASDVRWLFKCEKEIRRDVHKMHAFVRFRKLGEREDGREQYAAWFEPSHRILELGAPFFKNRFPNMDWAIATPDGTAVWDGAELRYLQAGDVRDVPDHDEIEEQWKTYYASIFNPARLKVSAMLSEMPKKYWKNLPEARLIPELITSATNRSNDMLDRAPGPANKLAGHLEKIRSRSDSNST
ncbi:MAG: TIGR03915 family putative DNA repair protein [Pseudomonadota bacterium]